MDIYSSESTRNKCKFLAGDEPFKVAMTGEKENSPWHCEEEARCGDGDAGRDAPLRRSSGGCVGISGAARSRRQCRSGVSGAVEFSKKEVWGRRRGTPAPQFIAAGLVTGALPRNFRDVAVQGCPETLWS